MAADTNFVRWFEDLRSEDVGEVGGKNASLGEMIAELQPEGIQIPGGFATTSEAYWQVLAANDLDDAIRDLIDDLHSGRQELHEVGEQIRDLLTHADFPKDIAEAIVEAYHELSDRSGTDEMDVAVRSSATAEDLPEASFAGQQETFLNVSGDRNLLHACKRCFASLFTDRAISYREEQGFDHLEVALSVGVQRMVRADRAGAGVMFSIDTETGFPDVVVIDAAWGLGEDVVQGTVNPDEYRVFKPLLGEDGYRPIIEKHLGEKAQKMVYTSGGSERTKNVPTTEHERSSFVLDDDEILTLGRWAESIEDHYGHAMDMEWAKDGDTGELFIVQARPETVQSQRDVGQLETYTLLEEAEPLVDGLAIGQAIATGKAQIIMDAAEIERFDPGSVLVTGMTDPDWVPIMKQAAAIVTDHGGRTSHAAIVSREFGIPALVGTDDATTALEDGTEITVSCAEGEEGYVYEGELEFETSEVDLSDLPEIDTQIMMNIASPAGAFRWWELPVEGIGLARMEFIINNIIQIHPMALVHFDRVEDRADRRTIEDLTHRYEDRREYFVEHLSRGIARIAASQYPEQVIVRMSDFKSNEYADLIGGQHFEPEEANPMLGFRGASRYYSEQYREGFALECQAIRRVREDIGFDNVVVMIPFCRTLAEADRVLEVLAENGLERGKEGLEVYVMAEIPSNVLLADQFAERFDGFSIGTNDLTQLVLGVDRDSEMLSEIFDERDEAVKRMVRRLIEHAHGHDRKVGICGQAPSDHPEFAEFLVRAGIDSMSLNPDSVVEVIHRVAEIEKQD